MCRDFSTNDDYWDYALKFIESSSQLENIDIQDAYCPRFVPVVSDSSLELRIVSIVLSAMATVPAFAKDTLQRFAVRYGKTSSLTCFAEVPFESGSGEEVRPDGVIQVRTGTKTWRAFVEAKVKNNEISPDQIEKYANVASKYDIDAIITISNQLAFLPTHLPYQPPRKFLKKLDFFHISWVSLLRHAQLLIRDQDSVEIGKLESFVLGEMIRYLDHPSSGVKGFEQMNSEWPSLINGVRDNTTFDIRSPEIVNTVTSWHQEERDLSLMLSARVGRYVSIRSTKQLKQNAALRFEQACKNLRESHLLQSSYSVPDAAADIDVTIDVTRRTIACSMLLESPKDLKKPTAVINWLLRQLKKIEGSDASDVTIRAYWTRKPRTTQAKLQEVRDNPAVLVNFAANAIPKSIEVVIIKEPTKQRFAGKRNFIQDLEKYVPEFYDRIGQNLRRWTPKPPKIDKRPLTQAPQPQSVQRTEVPKQPNFPIAVPEEPSSNLSPPSDSPEEGSPSAPVWRPTNTQPPDVPTD